MSPKYVPADSLASPRFTGVRTFMRLPHVPSLEDVDLLVCGDPFDTGGSFRVGARFGPEAIRSASVLLRPYNPVLEVNLAEVASVIDYGDVPVVPGYAEDSFARSEAFLRPVFAAGVVPLILGGDHSTTLPHLRAAARVHGPVGLVHFDAHSDTWDAYFGHRYNHGTPFRRAVEEGLLDTGRAVQVGMRGPLYHPDDLEAARQLGFEMITATEMRRLGLPEVIRRIRARAGAGPVFVSFDIDFVDPAFAPGTGTPEAGGVASWEALDLVRGLAGLQVVGADLVEVLPANDPAGVTATLAAHVGFELLSVFGKNLASRRKYSAHSPDSP